MIITIQKMQLTVRCLDAGKTIRIVSSSSGDFRYPWKNLCDVLLDLGLRPTSCPPLCVVFEFDERDALFSYEKYVRFTSYTLETGAKPEVGGGG